MIDGEAGPTPLTVAVVICASTEERWNEMMASVCSAKTQTRHAAEVILVVDHNPVLLRRAAFELPGVRVIPNSKEKGLSGARNTGVEAASSDIVAFLGDDTFAATNWIAALIDSYSSSEVLAVGGRVVPQWRSGRPGWFPPELDWVVGCSYRGMPDERAPVNHLNSANMSVRRELLQCEGFDADLSRIGQLPAGYDATELCLRLQRRHPEGRLVYEPAAAVRQGIPESWSTWTHFRSRCFSEGLSRAVVSNILGPEKVNPLGQSRAYSVIPRGVLRSLGAAVRGDAQAARAVLALCAGVAITGAGYVVGSRRLARHGLVRRRQGACHSVHQPPQRSTTSASRSLLTDSYPVSPDLSQLLLQDKEIHL